jgi:hypothetical protein
MAESLSLNLARPDDLEELLEALLGKKIEAKRYAPGQFVSGQGVVATYHDESGVLRAAVRSDRPVVNGCGAALSMIPVGAVEDANDEKEIPSNMFDNYREVLNIMASLFNDKRQRAEHVRLKDVFFTDEMPEEVTELLAQTTHRLDVTITVAGGYGSGGLALVAR